MRVRPKSALQRGQVIVTSTEGSKAGSGGGKQILFRAVALLELPTAFLGIWVGGTDLLSAPWLLSRLLGMMIFLLGLLVFAGVVVIARHPQLTPNDDRLILSGSVSGIVIDVIFMLNALHYNTLRFWLFALCALPCLAIAWDAFSWSLVRPYRKIVVSAGLAGGLLTILPFLYNTIYLPSTADVAVESSLSTSAPTPIGSGLDLVNLVITFQDKSTIAAVTLTSMVAVYGVTYHGQQAEFQRTPSQPGAISAGMGRSLIPNLEFAGARDSTLVTLRRPLRDGALINPGVALTTTVPVLLPVGRYQELDVQLMLWYSRSDRMTLTFRYFGPQIHDLEGCSNDDVRTAWFLSQSRLDLLTRGRETVVTDWCASVTDPYVNSFIGGAPGSLTPARIVDLEEQSYHTKFTSRFWVVDIPAKS